MAKSPPVENLLQLFLFLIINYSELDQWQLLVAVNDNQLRTIASEIIIINIVRVLTPWTILRRFNSDIFKIFIPHLQFAPPIIILILGN